LGFIDDYAHHPEEITACLSAVKELYPERRITGVFQPHLFSRTRDLAREFGNSLDLLDELFLLDIYPAREKPIKGVTSKMIFDHVSIDHKKICNKSTVIDCIKETDIEVLVTMGAGDIDLLNEPIKKCLEQKIKEHV
jgi:UDP-N-acetylmuramate--alanine ligase